MSLLMLLIRAVDFDSKRDHKQTDSNGLMDYDLVECTELYFYTAAYVELEYQWCSNTYFYSCFLLLLQLLMHTLRIVIYNTVFFCKFYSYST